MNKENQTDNFLDSLVETLEPVKPLLSPEKRALLWFFVHTVTIGAIMHLLRPFSSDLHLDFLMVRFSAEVLIFFVFSFLAAYAGFLSVIPGTQSKKLYRIAFAAMTLFAAIIAISFFSPAKPIETMASKRPHCMFEIMAFSLLPIAHMFYLMRKGIFDGKFKTLVVAFIGASVIPSGMMHFACMYDPLHIVKFHLGPSLFMGLLFAGIVVGFTKMLK